MLDPPSDSKRIDAQMTRIFRYLFRHHFCHSLWYEDLSDSGLLRELAKVIVLIPFGYSFDHSTDWRLNRGIIRKLLLKSSLGDWDTTVPGYDACDHRRWRLLYEKYEKLYPPGELPKEMAEKVEFMERWNVQLEFKDREGMDYCRGNDLYYEPKVDI